MRPSEIANAIKPFVLGWIKDASSNSGPSGSAGTGVAVHDFLGPQHTRPSLSAAHFLASPVVATGLPNFRAIALSDIQSVADTRYALAGRLINAGGGLTGGGALTADVTLNVGAGTGITVGADVVNVNEAHPFSWSASHTFGAGLAVSSANTITLGGDVSLNRSAADVLALGANDSIGTSSFLSGFSGSGWRVNFSGGFYNAEFDSLVVRGSMRVYELLIQKIRSGNGSFLFAPGGRVKSVSGGPTYTLTFDSDHGLASNGTTQKDIVRAQKFDLALGGVYTSVLQIESIIDTVTLTATVISGVAPQATYEYVRIGNTGDTNRQGGVYITSDDTNAPYIDIFDGVASAADWGSISKTKARIGRLTGAYGVSGTSYGIGLGDYTGGNYLKYDTAGALVMSIAGGKTLLNSTGLTMEAATAWPSTYTAGTGLRFMNGATSIGGVFASSTGNGNVIVGDPTNLSANTFINLSTGAGVSVYGNIFMQAAKFDSSSTAFQRSTISMYEYGVDIAAEHGSTHVGVNPAFVRVRANQGLLIASSAADFSTPSASTLYHLDVRGFARADELYLGSGSDVRLYRSAADMLRTPDNVTIDGTLNMSGFVKSVSGALVLNPASGGNVDVFSASSGIGLRVMDTSYSSTKVQLYNNGDGFFDGKLGIGTSGPAQKIHVLESGAGWVSFQFSGLTSATLSVGVVAGTTGVVSAFGSVRTSNGPTYAFANGACGPTNGTVDIANLNAGANKLQLKTDGSRNVQIVRATGDTSTWDGVLWVLYR